MIGDQTIVKKIMIVNGEEELKNFLARISGEHENRKNLAEKMRFRLLATKPAAAPSSEELVWLQFNDRRSLLVITYPVIEIGDAHGYAALSFISDAAKNVNAKISDVSRNKQISGGEVHFGQNQLPFSRAANLNDPAVRDRMAAYLYEEIVAARQQKIPQPQQR